MREPVSLRVAEHSLVEFIIAILVLHYHFSFTRFLKAFHIMRGQSEQLRGTDSAFAAIRRRW